MKKLALYFLLAYLISWLIWLPLWLPYFGVSGLPVLPYHHYFGSVGPVSAAFIVTYYSEGMNGVKELSSRIFKWKISVAWYIVAIAGPFLIYVIASVAAAKMGNQSFKLSDFGHNNEFPQFSAPAFFLFNLVPFGFGEEVGWRGFALPCLQKKFNAFTSTVLLTIFWAVWHAPAFLYRPNYTGMNIAGFVGFFFSLLMGGVILTWLSNSTKGSILVVALFHAMIEMIFMAGNVTPLISNIEGAFIMV